MNTFTLEIFTPARTVLRAEAREAVLRGANGFFGVLPGHAPLLARLAPGPLRFRGAQGELLFHAGAGLAEITPRSLTVLVDAAEPAANDRTR